MSHRQGYSYNEAVLLSMCTMVKNVLQIQRLKAAITVLSIATSFPAIIVHTIFLLKIRHENNIVLASPII